MAFDASLLLRHAPLLLQGLAMTVAASLVALAIGIAGGALLLALRRAGSRWASAPAAAFVHVFRVTPEMILIFWAYFCLPYLLDWKISGFWTGTIVLGLVAAAYLSEIFRAGVASIGQGQWDAGRALGLGFRPLWGLVVLPPALRAMIPALVNYFTELVKNTTLLSAIGVGELALQAYLLGGQTFRYLEFLTAIAIGYFLLIFPASLAARRLERRAAT